jgi:hypothetical protein
MPLTLGSPCFKRLSKGEAERGRERKKKKEREGEKEVSP